MRHQLELNEKCQIAQACLNVERAAFPGISVRVIVEGYTAADGEPIVWVMRAEDQQDLAIGPGWRRSLGRTTH
jgi:hypothetical protein